MPSKKIFILCPSQQQMFHSCASMMTIERCSSGVPSPYKRDPHIQAIKSHHKWKYLDMLNSNKDGNNIKINNKKLNLSNSLY